MEKLRESYKITNNNASNYYDVSVKLSDAIPIETMWLEGIFSNVTSMFIESSSLEMYELSQC